MAQSKDRTNEEMLEGERLALSDTQARGGPDRPVEGIDERTSPINPDSALDTRPHPDLQALGGSEQGGMAGAVGTFEGEGNEGAVAPLGGDPSRSFAEGHTGSQAGAASGAPGSESED
jgi:hypothetical protein